MGHSLRKNSGRDRPGLDLLRFGGGEASGRRGLDGWMGMRGLGGGAFHMEPDVERGVLVWTMDFERDPCQVPF